MKLTTALILLIAAPLLFADSPQPPAQTDAKWKLVFEDNFDGDKLDLKKWSPRDPFGVERNNELQAYVADAFVLKDGVLHVTAQKREADYAGKHRQYTSGMMCTTGLFAQKFGRFEIRCRVPKGKGMWPAFWMLPEPPGWPPEIDVLETLGHEPAKLHMTHHWHSPDKQLHSDTHEWSGPDLSADFHIIAAEWDADHIAWFVDGVERFRSTKNIPQVPMFMLVNLAVGGDWPGSPDDKTPMPNSFDVDYVRVYQLQP